MQETCLCSLHVCVAAWNLQCCCLLLQAYGVSQWLHGQHIMLATCRGAISLQAAAQLEMQHAVKQADLERKAAGQELAALRAEIASTAEQLEACREQHKQQQSAQQHVQEEVVQVRSAAAQSACFLCALATLPSLQCSCSSSQITASSSSWVQNCRAGALSGRCTGCFATSCARCWCLLTSPAAGS